MKVQDIEDEPEKVKQPNKSARSNKVANQEGNSEGTTNIDKESAFVGSNQNLALNDGRKGSIASGTSQQSLMQIQQNFRDSQQIQSADRNSKISIQPKISAQKLSKMNTKSMQQLMDSNIYDEMAKTADLNRLKWFIIPHVIGGGFYIWLLWFLTICQYEWVEYTVYGWVNSDTSDRIKTWFLYDCIWIYFLVYFQQMIGEMFYKFTNGQRYAMIWFLYIFYGSVLLVVLNLIVGIKTNSDMEFGVTIMWMIVVYYITKYKVAEDKKLLSLVAFEIFLCLVYCYCIDMAAYMKMDNMSFPLGTCFIAWQVFGQMLIKTLLFQGLKYNLFVVDMCQYFSLSLKIVGISFGFIDLHSCPENQRWRYYPSFVANQLYMFTYFHYLIHPCLFALKFIVSLKCLDGVRKKILATINKVMYKLQNSAMKNCIQTCFEKAACEPVYDISDDDMKDLTENFNKQQAFLQGIAITMFVIRLAVLWWTKTVQAHFPLAIVDLEYEMPVIKVVMFLLLSMLVIVVGVNHWKKLGMFTYYDSVSYTVFEKVLQVLFQWWVMDNFCLKFMMDDNNDPWSSQYMSIYGDNIKEARENQAALNAAGLI